MVRASTRREALVMLGVTGAALAAGCGSDSSTSPTATDPPSTNGTGCAASPSETIGPFPSLADFARSDIREGRPGTPLTLTERPFTVTSTWMCVARPAYHPG